MTFKIILHFLKKMCLINIKKISLWPVWRLMFAESKGGDRERYRERVREREGKRERDGDWERKTERERDPHKLEGEASIDHPIGEGLG